MTHLGWVALAGLVGVAGNELAALVRIRTGRRIGSAALVADGFHARADTMASVAVLVAVGGTWLGFPIVDPIVGLVICGLILWIAKETAVQIFRRLMDGVDTAIVDRIEMVSSAAPGVQAVDWVRARWSGHRLHADLAIAVDADLTVREGHAVAEQATRWPSRPNTAFSTRSLNSSASTSTCIHGRALTRTCTPRPATTIRDARPVRLLQRRWATTRLWMPSSGWRLQGRKWSTSGVVLSRSRQ